MFRFQHTAKSISSRRWLHRQVLQQGQSSSVYLIANVSQPISAACTYYSSSCHLSQKDDNNDSPKSKIEAEWIPPNRPLHGDQDHSQLFKTQKDLDRAEDALFTIEDEDSEEEILKRLEQALALEEKLQAEREKKFAKLEEQDNLRHVDWLQTRRQALGTQQPGQTEVPIKHHELLSENELTTLLEFFGGQDVLVLHDDEKYPRMGGADGMILCTAESPFLVRSITKNLVSHLKERHLQDLGVVGAKMGKQFLQSMSRESTWHVLDCRNFIVHIMDAKTRNALNLEDLWSGKDPLWKLNTNDEDLMDDYVAEHYVPFAYGPNTEGLYGDATISKLQRQQWLTPHRPVIPFEQKLKDRRAERRKRRERKRQEAKEAYYH